MCVGEVGSEPGALREPGCAPARSPLRALEKRTHLKMMVKEPAGMAVPRVRDMDMPVGVPAGRGAAALHAGARLVMFMTPVPRGRFSSVTPQAATGGLE